MNTAKSNENPERIDEVTEEDFSAVWNPSGARRAWLRLGRVIARTPDFPLQPDENHPEVLVGDVAAALERASHDSETGLRLTVAERILARIVQIRETQ